MQPARIGATTGNDIRYGALAVVLTGDRVLLARRRNPPDAGLWGFPGGHVEVGETAEVAAVRELAEETSVIARPLRELDVFDLEYRRPDGHHVHFRLTAIHCRYVSGTPSPADDVVDAAWVAQSDVAAGRLPMSDRVVSILRLAVRASRR